MQRQKSTPSLIKGVALIVQYKESAFILIVKEFENHPEVGKVNGMLSIPMETKLNGESDRKALQRLIREELNGIKIKILYPMGIYKVMSIAKVKLYVGRAEYLTLPKDNKEVGGFCWMLPSEAFYLHLRPGAREMIFDYYCKRREEDKLSC